MKNISRLGIELDPINPDNGFEPGMDNAKKYIIWGPLLACAFVGLALASGVIIAAVKFINWVMCVEC